MPKKAIDLTGQRFGRWFVLKRGENDKNRNIRWHCRCDCGKERIVQGGGLQNGQSRGCQSCQLKKLRVLNITHGQGGTRLYHIWWNMLRRCENPNATDYERYGGRGIKVCAEWRDAAMFFKWALSHGYKNNLSIDRIDNDGDYSPDNCRFVTAKEQNRNTRRNRLVKIGKEIKPMCVWAEQAGISNQVLKKRIKRGWSGHRLLEPVRREAA